MPLVSSRRTGCDGHGWPTICQFTRTSPWFKVVVVAASPSSAGQPYRQAVAERWHMLGSIPVAVADLTVRSVVDDLARIAHEVDLAFCALNMDKAIRRIECDYAAAGVAVVSIILPTVGPKMSP